MPLNLYNTLTKNKELFKPIESNHIKIYSCGPAVYDLLRVANSRGAFIFNLVRNWLKRLAYKDTDQIKDQLHTMGIEFSDMESGVAWNVKF